MCGRLAFFEPQNLKARYNLKLIPTGLTGENNFSPGMSGPVIVNHGGNRTELMKWGLGYYNSFNARAETILAKPTYRQPFLTQRCLVPANGFYEWHEKLPYYIYNQRQKIMSFAGIYDNGTFSIITTLPNREIQPIHERMPVILNETD